MPVFPESLQRRAIVALAMAACAFLYSPFVPAAEIYRWVDENGRVQYGDRPPSDTATRIDLPTAPEADADVAREQDAQEKVLEVLEDERMEREQGKAASEAEARMRRANCERARTELGEARDAAFLYVPGSDPGNPHIMTEEERAAATRNLEQHVRKWCGPAAAE